jgi:secreted trypsin-like serine protease
LHNHDPNNSFFSEEKHMKSLRSYIPYVVVALAFIMLIMAGYTQMTASAADVIEGPSAPISSPFAPGPNIVGGTAATIDQYPWQAAIMSSDQNSQYCGGALVHAQWVLTAAHCFVDDQNGDAITPVDQIGVALGRTDWTLNDGQFILIEQLILHPDYLGSGKASGDVALLKLAQPATLGPNVAVIPMATAADAAQTATGITAWVSGWGNTTFNGTGSNTLLAVDVPILDNQACIDAGFGVIASHLCAGGVENKDSCQGDSGGPLVVPNAQNNGSILAGVVSYGPDNGCGLAGIPGVYERVSSWADWVNQQIGGVTQPTPTATATTGPTPTATTGPTPTATTEPPTGQGGNFLPLVLKNAANGSSGGNPTPTATATQDGGGPTPTPTATTQPGTSDWLNYVNQLRSYANLAPVTDNATYSAGCLDHAQYMVKNDFIGHTEDPQNQWYTDAGLAAAQAGNVSINSNPASTYKPHIDGWMNGPFHGIGIIDPTLVQTGFGLYNEAIGQFQSGACLDVNRGIDFNIMPNYPVIWPADGKTLPADLASYGGFESPDPLTPCGYTAPTGAPIYLQLGQFMDPNVTNTSFQQGGMDLAHCSYTGATYTNPNAQDQTLGQQILNARGAVVIIPQAPLAAGTYDVSVSADGQDYNWSFTVAGAK